VGSIGLLVQELSRELAAFDPGVYSGAECATLVEKFARVENALSAARLRAAVRAGECGAHRARGFADPSDWLASSSGSTIRDSRAALDAVRVVEVLPETRDALVAGEVSIAQAAEIARTEAEVPGSEAELLELAKSASLGAVRDRARKRRVAAIRPEELYARQHASRAAMHWTDEIGLVWLRVGLTPELGLPIVARLDKETDRVWRESRRSGRCDSRAACAADAFVRLWQAQTGSGSKQGGSDVVFVCSLDAYRRGHVHEGEMCHVVGGGPVPVPVIRAAAKDAFLKVAFDDGVEIRKVAHLGRHIPAELRTALELGPLPELDGIVCEEEGCDRRYGLEWHHVDPVANGGMTSKEQLRALCKPHHVEETERQRAAGLFQEPTDRAPP
jgi:hypothetical protein